MGKIKMHFHKSSVFNFFANPKKTYEIPVYQRAYSWEKENWQAFLDDLKEQLQGDNNYFFGNILLETITPDKLYEVIDGQQRLTTLTIFIRALLNVTGNKADLPEDFDADEKYETYLKSRSNIKLRPVEYDKACYDALIIDNQDFPPTTPSQKRLKDAKEFFEKNLNGLQTDVIIQILDKLEETQLTSIELSDKKDSALMFELENNRGKGLTNMEKIKSYFMYQMYVYSKPDEIDTNINAISDIFKQIYLKINELKLNEDSVLLYHNMAYIKGFSYRNLDDLKEVFKKSSDKVEWIKDYVRELYNTFFNLSLFEKSTDFFAQNLVKLGIPAFVYPFIIKGYKYCSNKPNEAQLLNELFHLLEILAFRQKLINSRAKIEERLNDILRSFNGDMSSLSNDLKIKLNDAWYWGDKNTEDYLNSVMYGNKVLNYLLWQYEDSIQKNQGYTINVSIDDDEQIEHISPQTPTDGNPIATGYDINANNQYSEDFISNQLNCIGNLMLIAGTHNRVIGNKPFEDKLATYLNSPLSQQIEIKKFSKIENNKNVWKKDSIIERQKKIVDFAMQTWSF